MFFRLFSAFRAFSESLIIYSWFPKTTNLYSELPLLIPKNLKKNEKDENFNDNAAVLVNGQSSMVNGHRVASLKISRKSSYKIYSENIKKRRKRTKTLSIFDSFNSCDSCSKKISVSSVLSV